MKWVHALFLGWLLQGCSSKTGDPVPGLTSSTCTESCEHFKGKCGSTGLIDCNVMCLGVTSTSEDCMPCIDEKTCAESLNGDCDPACGWSGESDCKTACQAIETKCGQSSGVVSCDKWCPANAVPPSRDCQSCAESSSCDQSVTAGFCDAECGWATTRYTIEDPDAGTSPDATDATLMTSGSDATPVIDAGSADADTSADLGTVTNCPYAASAFSCSAACENLMTLATLCANDSSLPANLHTVLAAIDDAPEARKRAVCSASCAATSPQDPEQWSCFQAAPSDSCIGIAGCTIVNCPQ